MQRTCFLMLLVAFLSSASAVWADRIPLVPLTSGFAHWDHHWFVRLPRHPVYESVEVASLDAPEHPVRLIWVFFTERAGLKRQVHYLNNPAVAAQWPGSWYREMQYARRGAVGQPQGVTVHLQDKDQQPVDIDITVDAGPLRPAGLANQAGHAATSHFLVFFREQRAVAVQQRVVMAGEDVAANPDAGGTAQQTALASYSTNVYTVVLPFITTRVRYAPDAHARASGLLFVPTHTTAEEVVYTWRAQGAPDVVQLVMTTQGGLKTYTHQAGPYSFTIRFAPPLVWEPDTSPEPVTYSMSLDHFPDLVRGQVQT